MSWRLQGYMVAALVVGATAYPFFWPLDRDSFPLSPYPMFSGPRPHARVTIQYAVGVEFGGGRVHLAPELVANQEVLQARAVLNRAVARGRLARDALCRSIAERVAAAGADLATVTEVRIVTGTHDSVAYLTGRDKVGREVVHAACPVLRSQSRGEP